MVYAIWICMDFPGHNSMTSRIIQAKGGAGSRDSGRPCWRQRSAWQRSCCHLGGGCRLFRGGARSSPVYTQLMEMPQKYWEGSNNLMQKMRKVILKGFPRTLVHCLGCCRIMTSGLQMQFFPYHSIPPLPVARGQRSCCYIPIFEWKNESPNIPKLISIPISSWILNTSQWRLTTHFRPWEGFVQPLRPPSSIGLWPFGRACLDVERFSAFGFLPGRHSGAQLAGGRWIWMDGVVHGPL